MNKTVIIVAALAGGYVWYRHRKLGHFPHSLAELLPGGKPCCDGCAGGTPCAGTSTKVAAAGVTVKPITPPSYETAPIFTFEDDFDPIGQLDAAMELDAKTFTPPQQQKNGGCS